LKKHFLCCMPLYLPPKLETPSKYEQRI